MYFSAGNKVRGLVGIAIRYAYRAKYIFNKILSTRKTAY
jgi:hypothetical protein